MSITETKTTVVGEPFTYKILGIASNYYVAVTGLPAGFSFNPVTREIRGVAREANDFTITIVASIPNITVHQQSATLNENERIMHEHTRT